MARLVTAGAEWGDTAWSTGSSDGLVQPFLGGGGDPTIESSVVRSGAKSYKYNTGPSGSNTNLAFFTNLAGYDRYMRTYFRVPALPISGKDVALLKWLDTVSDSYGTSTANILTVSLNGNNSLLQIADNNGSGTGPTINIDTWYMLEVRVKDGASGAWEVRLDGTSYRSGTADFSFFNGQGEVDVGASPLASLPTNYLIYMDDLAMNDASGSSQTSWPGSAKIVVLRPVSDNARSAGMTGGAGSTTNLFDAEDNTPPVGVVVGSATNASQIKDVAASATDNYDANVTDYTTAGVGSGDTIALVQAVANIGNSASNSRSMAVQAVSNPADSGEATVGSGGTAAGTYPTGWTWLRGNIAYAPSVTKGTQPVVRFGKRSTSTEASMADAIGLVIEYSPAAAAAPIPNRERTISQAVQRGATR